MKKTSRFINPELISLSLSLFLFACSRHQPASTEQVAQAINSSPQVAALQKQPGQTLQHDQTVQDSTLRTEKFKHYDQGIEVLGSGADYHESGDDSETGKVSAHLATVPDSLNVTPSITPIEAEGIAESTDRSRGKSIGTPFLMILPKNSRTLGSLKSARLIYQVNLDSGNQVWIDAHEATHLATLPAQNNSKEESSEVKTAERQGAQVTWNTDKNSGEPTSCGVLALNHNESGDKELKMNSCRKIISTACQIIDPDGTPLTFNASNCPSVTMIGGQIDPAAERANENALKFLDYFQKTFQRDSYDDRGSPVISVVHAGQQFANALWYNKQSIIAYGEGDGKTFRDFTFGLDVAGHELTHGVIQTTAGLVMAGETGALNESIADYFGKRIEGQDDWTFGHTLGMDETYKGIRDLKDPASLEGEIINSDGTSQTKPYPVNRVDEAPVQLPCTSENDFCAVHFNATVFGHAWYKIDATLGHSKTEKLLYLTLTHFLTPMTDFDTAPRATLEACSHLLTDSDCRSVREVFVTSGLLSP